MRHESERGLVGSWRGPTIHQSRSPRLPLPPSLLIRLSLMHPRRDIYIVVRLAVTDAERICKMGKLVEDLSLAQKGSSASGNADADGVIKNILLMC